MTQPASEIQWLNERAAFWQVFDPRVKTDLSCCALLTSTGLVFVDPIPLGKSALAELTGVAKPVAIVVTNSNHERAAAEFRTRFSIPICAHADALAALDVAVDRGLSDAEAIVPGLVTFAVAGAVPGELALRFESHLVAIGDALINVESHGFTFLPDKYCDDPKVMRVSLGKLLRFDFEVMTFAHGSPLVSGARSRLASLLT